MGLNAIPQRIDNPTTIDTTALDALVAAGKTVAIQFSKPGYSESDLQEIDRLCARHGTLVEVRFYGFYGTTFDASCVRYIPNAAAVYVDCLSRATSLDALAELPRLEVLSLGVHYLDCDDLLYRLPLEQLRELRLMETATSNLDLKPLARCRRLESVFLAAQTRGIDALRGLPKVARCGLHMMPRKQSLGLVNDLPCLEALSVMLGGRDDIAEISNSNLHQLRIARVRGFKSAGDLARFPLLESLQIEDQIQLNTIDLSRAPRLRDVRLLNCKTLRDVGSLATLRSLEHLRIGRTAIDLTKLIDAGLPPSARIVALYGTGKAENTRLRSRLDALGYAEFG